MIELKFSVQKLQEIVKKGYSLEMVAFLQVIEQGGDIEELSKDSVKLGSIVQSVYRKGLVSDNHNITVEGKELLAFFSSEEKDIKLVKKKIKDDPFLLWWAEFPSTDSFSYKGKEFKGTRSLKAKKEDCKVKILSILNEGQYTIQELIDALKIEKEQKAENSHKTNSNKMSFFQNSHTYLLNFTYESYVELVRKGYKVKTEKQVENQNYDGVNI